MSRAAVSAAPLSMQQEGIWFDALLEPDSPRFNVATVVPYRGRLDASDVRGALEAVARRHSVLRSTFEATAHSGRQVAHESLPSRLHVVDLRREPDRSRDARVREVLLEARRSPFALDRELHTATLVQLADDAHLIALTAHHLVSDDRSMDIWARELTALCGQGPSAPLPPLPIQYADYATWQRRWLEEPDIAARARARARRLAGMPPRAPLPTGADRAPAAHRFPVPARLLRPLREVAARERASAFAGCLAVFAALLREWLDREDVVVGTIMPGRVRAEVGGLIGCFANIVVMRLRVEDGLAFTDLLGRARREAVDAWSQQELPFASVVEALNPPRQLGLVPITGIGFQFVEAAQAGSDREWAAEEAGEAPAEASPFDVELVLGARPDGSASGTIRTRGVADVEPSWLARRYVELLERAASDPSGPLRPVRRPRPETARPAAPDPAPDGWAAVPELVRARAASRPHAPAVRCGERELDFAELVLRADGLAVRLQAAGAGRGAHVGVLLGRSEHLVVALLGILAAGAAYVPLDPSYPEERLLRMAERAGLAAIVAAGAPPPALRRLAPRVVEPDGAVGARPERVDLGPADLAYVMFTSGSTGQPKGVMIEHGALTGALRAIQREVGLSSEDRMLAVTSVSFDISVVELVLPLMAGGTVIVAPDQAHRQPGELLRLARAERATVMQATPAAWRMVVEAGGGERWVRALCGGDTLGPDLAAELVRLASAAWNLYGPTEATIWALAARLPEAAEATVPIGHPLDSATCEVVAEDLRPVQPGSVGELLIGGPSLARGYLGSPGATAERFLPAAGGARCYRTGDLARQRADGAYEHLGRMDGQVKVRGFRIEVGEVELALRGHPAVRDAAVTAEQEATGERTLVAHLCLVAAVTAAALRAHVARRLPDHMVPSRFLVVDELPLTGSGKVDRRALHRGLGRPLAGAGDQAPATETERRVLELCAELMGAGAVSLDDDLFLLGGHSLMLVQLVGRVRRAFGVGLPLRVAYERRTVRALASTIDELRRTTGSERRPPLVRLPREG